MTVEVELEVYQVLPSDAWRWRLVLESGIGCEEYLYSARRFDTKLGATRAARRRAKQLGWTIISKGG